MVVTLYETQCAELEDLLRDDTDARVADVPPDTEPLSVIRYLGLRLNHLLNPPSWRSMPARGVRDPEDAAEGLLLMLQLIRATSSAAQDVLMAITQDYRDGRLTAASAGDAHDMRQLAEALTDTAGRLNEMLTEEVPAMLAEAKSLVAL